MRPSESVLARLKVAKGIAERLLDNPTPEFIMDVYEALRVEEYEHDAKEGLGLDRSEDPDWS